MKILLQFPEGLKDKALAWVERLEKEGHTVFLSARPSYGACDLPVEEARALGVEKIIHFGHVAFPRGRVDGVLVEYVVERRELGKQDMDRIIKGLKEKGVKAVTLTAIIQYTKTLPILKAFLEERGIAVELKRGLLAIEEGQLLGCDGSAGMGQGDLLFIGDGLFHPTAVPYKDGRRYFAYNPSEGHFYEITDKVRAYWKRRRAAVLRAYDARVFGILVSTKQGQFLPRVAESIKKELARFGKKAVIIVGNELIPTTIANFTFVDAFITTACPRIADDVENYRKPVLDLAMFAQLKALWRGKSLDEVEYIQYGSIH